MVLVEKKKNMSEKKNSTALVPTKKNNSLPVPVKKGELKTPFSLVDKAIIFK